MKTSAVIFLCLSLAAAARAQDAVRLLTHARVAPGAPVTLGDIAQIDGPNAAALRAVRVDGGDQPTVRVDVARVQELLGATPGVNVGRVALSGREVRIERAEPVKPAPGPAAAVQQPTTGPTVRASIPAVLAQELRIDPADLRLSFDESDAAVLGTALTGRTHTVSMIGTGDKPGVHIRVYEGDKLVLAKTIRVGVLVRRQVALAAKTVERGGILDESSLIGEERWLSPTTKAVDSAAAAGRTARARINAGEVIEARMVEEPIAVRKGDLVAVDCVSSAVVVRTTMRARADARAGELVELAPVAPAGSKKQRARDAAPTVTARVAGPGRAVVSHAPAGETQ
ncbi:MAG TPA: flagellar basal body P-ring formation chaperone FlgA [Phycisphaerales bacterium]|nr:flagellar basal body P-ring formation chaperone FlgA [Phycisphaerales bacterium]